MVALALLLTCGTSLAAAAGDEDTRPRALVLDFQGNAVNEETRKSITGLVVVKLAKDPRLDVVSGQEIKGLAALAADKQEAGCDDACLAEIAGAMDARLVVSGFVGKLGSLYVVNLSMFDAEKARAMGRATVEAESIEQLPSKLDASIDEMLRDLPGPKPRRRVPSEREPASGPPLVALGLLGGGAVGMAGGLALVGITAAMVGDVSNARTALDDEARGFDGDVDALTEAHDAYVEKRDAYNDVGPVLFWSGAALAVLGMGALAAGGVMWSAE